MALCIQLDEEKFAKYENNNASEQRREKLRSQTDMEIKHEQRRKIF